MRTKQAVAVVQALPPAKQPINATVAMLMVIQLEEWDTTTFLGDTELIEGLTAKGFANYHFWQSSVRSYRAHYPDAVSYSVVDGEGKLCYGMRYGFRGEEYISF